MLTDILRSFSFFLDKVIYGFVGTVYNLLVEIAETSIFTEEVIDIFAGKIYALLGIFMLFKVSFSILTYIVSPDDFVDKNKGFGKLISSILITLTLLVVTPWLFSQAMEVQRIILRDNIIGKIFINTGSGTSTSSMADPGNLMAYQTYKAFFHVDTSLYPACEIQSGSGDPQDFNNCDTQSGLKDLNAHLTTLKYSEQANSVSIYMDDDLLNAKGSDGGYFMTYIPFISVACGLVLLLLLIVFCFDIAVRSVKLGFLRMIAPVPIVSRIDPKKGKEVFDKWFKMVLSTYLDLFIRLIAIYFAVFVISIVTQNLGTIDAVTGLRKSPNAFVIVFIVLGSLLFAKQLPKLIEDLTGFKMDGKFTLNPLKKVSTIPAIGAGAALAAGGIDSAIHGHGFVAGVKRNMGNVPLSGGDGKKSILDTADRKMRVDARKKSDEGIMRQKSLRTQLKKGEEWAAQGDKVYDSKFLKSKQSVDDAKGTMYAWQNQVDKAQGDYQAAVTRFGQGSQEAQSAFNALENAKKQAGSAQGQYEYRKKLHDAMRQQMPKQAEIEDAIEAWEKAGGGKPIQAPPEMRSPQVVDELQNTTAAFGDWDT